MKLEYYITDGNRFVKQNIKNQYSLVGNYAIADCWDKYQVAKAVLDNSVPNAWRRTFYVAQLRNGVMEKKSLTQDEKGIVKSEATTLDNTCNSYELKLKGNKKDFGMDTLITAFEIVGNYLGMVEKELQEQQNRLQFLNYAFEDVKHHHLQENLGTVKAYKRDNLESEILGERLLVKNKIEICQKISQHKQSMSKAVEDICRTFDIIKNKKYAPRVLPELFEQGVDAITPELLDKIAQNGRISRR